MRLKKLRQQIKATQEQVANAIGVTQFTYSNYETKKTEPDIATLCKIADYYEVSLDYLCDHKTANILDLSQKSPAFKSLLSQIQNFDDNKLILMTGYAIRLGQE